MPGRRVAGAISAVTARTVSIEQFVNLQSRCSLALHAGGYTTGNKAKEKNNHESPTSNVQRPTSAFPRLKVHIPFDSFAIQTCDIPFVQEV